MVTKWRRTVLWIWKYPVFVAVKLWRFLIQMTPFSRNHLRPGMRKPQKMWVWKYPIFVAVTLWRFLTGTPPFSRNHLTPGMRKPQKMWVTALIFFSRTHKGHKLNRNYDYVVRSCWHPLQTNYMDSYFVSLALRPWATASSLTVWRLTTNIWVVPHR